MSIAKVLVGQWLDGKYHLQRYIGRGSFGYVFEADHVVAARSLRPVAVKLIELNDAEAREQMNELASAATLDHPHILRHFDFGQSRIAASSSEADVLYLVMELASGTLDGRLRSGLLGTASAAKLAAQISSALVYLQVQSKVHRDIKPDNILRVGDQWKLADVGIARDVGVRSAVVTRAQGAQSYMPPEAILEHEVSPAGDVWSLGATLLESLTGRLPYFAESQAEWIQVLHKQEPDIPAGLPEPFDSIIRGCLQKDRHRRWTAAQVHAAIQGVPTGPIQGDSDTFTVGPHGAQYTTLAKAVDAAPSGARIVVQPGIYAGTVTIRRRVEIVAFGAVADVVLEGNGGAALVFETPDAIVRGVTVRSSRVGERKGQATIEIRAGRPLIDQCDITSDLPACVRVESPEANPIIRRCRIRQGRETGVWFTAGARGALEDCEVTGQSVAGIWIADDANPIVRRCIVQRSKVRGVFVSERGQGFIDACFIMSNDGPGIEVTRDAHVVVRDCKVINNHGPGLLATRGARVLLLDSDMTRNEGGAVTGSGTTVYKANIEE
jgi:hypothetical protein